MNYNKSEFHYFKEAILFLKEVNWIYNVPVTRIMVEDSIELIPTEWIEAISKLNYNELNHFVSKLKVKVCKCFIMMKFNTLTKVLFQSYWPVSLINFIDKCRYFNKLPSPNRAFSLVELPKIFMKKLSLKKQHEIFHLAQAVHKQCSLQNILTIVDLGAGLVNIYFK
jgi:hypothetical protein